MAAINEKRTVTKMVRIGWTCDVCGIEIPKGAKITMSCSHGDWGNDSIESYKYYDVCSPKCYEEKALDICEAPDYNSRSSRIDDTPVSVWKHILKVKDKK